MPRPSEWESRWWSPIINAEHLAMRDSCGACRPFLFVILDVTGPGAMAVAPAPHRSAQMDVPVGRVVYTSLLDERGRVQVRPHGDAAWLRTLPGCHRRCHGHDGGKSGRRSPGRGTAPLSSLDLTSGFTTFGLWGPRPEKSSGPVTDDDISNAAFPFGELPVCRDRRLSGVLAVADLLCRRARLGALRAHRRGRPRSGTRSV